MAYIDGNEVLFSAQVTETVTEVEAVQLKGDFESYDNGVIVMPAPSGWALGALNGYGEVTAHARRMVSDLFEVYRGYKWEIGVPEGYFVTVAFYDESCNCTGVDAEYQGQYFFFDEIKEAKYIRIQLKKTDDTAIEDLTVGNQVTIKANSKANKVAEIVKQITTHGKNLYNHAKSYYSNRGNGTGGANLKILNSEWIELEPNSKYRLTYWTDVDASASVVYTIIDGEGNETTSGTGIYVSKTSAVEITTGEGTHLFRFSPYVAESNYTMERMMLEKVTSPMASTEFEPYKETVDFAKLLPTALWNPWIGKKMVVDGDSITHDFSEFNFWQFNAAKALGMYLDNTVISADDDAVNGVYGCGWRGIGGSTIANETQAKINAGQTVTEDPLSRSITLRYQNLPDDADIVLIAAGSNDWAHNVIEMGDFDSTDDTTFNGALNILLPALKTKYPSIPVVMMTPIKRGRQQNSTNGKGYTLQQFADALIVKCRQYGVYCLDMWGTCPISPQIPIMLEQFFRPNDDTHPNAQGHAIMGRTVAGFIRTLS